jgi:hypothetical protein
MRRDVYVYNEATGWTLTSLGMNGRVAVPESRPALREWARGIERGDFIPISLVQDDALVVRVVVDEALTEQEAAEWVDYFAARLAVPDGKLVLCGGAEFLWEPGLEGSEDYMRVVEVPPGEYLAEVYTQLPGVNGPMNDEDDLKAYWRQTRKRERMPAWLKDEVPDDTYLVDFVVRLTPLAAPPDEPPLEDGWIPTAVHPRLPEKCPRGLETREVAGLTDRPEPVQTDLVYLYHVPEQVAALAPAPVAGGPVPVPVRDLVLPYWLAWCCGETHPYVRVSGCPGLTIDWPGVTEGIKATPTGDGWRVDIEGMNARFSQFGHLRQIGQLLAALPDGARIEVAAAENEDEDGEAGGPPPGFQRYLGPVRAGEWRIEQTFPPVDHATLAAMLALAAEAERQEGFRVRDKAEGERILAQAETHDFLLRDKLPRLDGLTLRLRQRDEGLTPFLAARIYLVRFGRVWPTQQRDDDLEQWDAMMDRIAAAGARWATGERVHEGSFASYTRTDFAAMEGTDREQLAALDAAMAGFGFELLGDLHSTQTFQAVFRGYGQADSPVYGALVKGSPAGPYEGQFYTVFEDGYSLTTAAEFDRKLRRFAKPKMLELGVEGGLPERYAAHCEKVAELAPKHRGARPAVPTLAAFAAAHEEYMIRQHACAIG